MISIKQQSTHQKFCRAEYPRRQVISNQLSIYCDGGARGNPGPAAWGFMAVNNKGINIYQQSKYIGKATNNVAEYKGVLNALKWLKKNHNHSNIKCNFYLDSLLVVNQLNGIYKIKNSNLQYLVIQIKSIENQIKSSIFYKFIPREKNKQADALVNEALDTFTNPS